MGILLKRNVNVQTENICLNFSRIENILQIDISNFLRTCRFYSGSVTLQKLFEHDKYKLCPAVSKSILFATIFHHFQYLPKLSIQYKLR